MGVLSGALSTLFFFAAAVVAEDVPVNNNNGVAAKNASFDLAIAKNLILFSYGAYCPYQEIQSWTCKFCKRVPDFTLYTIITNKTTDGFAFVGYHKGLNAVIFTVRGTSSPLNIIEDLRIAKVQVPFPGMPADAKIEHGFAVVYHSLAIHGIPALQSALAQHPGARVMFTGHSLGAALTTLFQIGARQKGIYGDVYDYGCPRIGNPEFHHAYDALNLTHWRLVNKNDPIPHLPPRELHYQHSKWEIWEHDNNYQQCDSSGEDWKCSDHEVNLNGDDHNTYMQEQWGCP